MINAKKVRELFDYNEETGMLTRKTNTGGRTIGSVAGWKSKHGYLEVRACRKIYKAHRLIWLYVYGEWPMTDIDHINRNKTDNRIINLRLCNNSQNRANSIVNRNSKSRIKGVSWHRLSNKWTAQIMVNWSNIYLGVFENKEDAALAYKNAANKYFGEFARS